MPGAKFLHYRKPAVPNEHISLNPGVRTRRYSKNREKSQRSRQ